VDGEDCWIIEIQPKTAKEKTETGYAKAQLWISKQKLLLYRPKLGSLKETGSNTSSSPT